MQNPQKPLENQHPLLQPLYIGGLEIKNRLFVAPMAGVTDNYQNII